MVSVSGHTPIIGQQSGEKAGSHEQSSAGVEQSTATSVDDEERGAMIRLPCGDILCQRPDQSAHSSCRAEVLQSLGLQAHHVRDDTVLQ